jgi:hypothetical protein
MIRLLLQRGANPDARDKNGNDNAETSARFNNKPQAAALLADARRRYPRFRLLMLRILAEQGRTETQDALLRRLFPTEPAPEELAPLACTLLEAPGGAAFLTRALKMALAAKGVEADAVALAADQIKALAAAPSKRPREAYRAQKGGRLPRGIFVHIPGYWRSSRDDYFKLPRVVRRRRRGALVSVPEW